MTSDLGFMLRGLVMGFSIAAPVGPIGVLCIRRTLADGPGVGLATGLDAAAADGIYGAMAGFGLTWLTRALIAQQVWIGLAGGLFLLFLGLTTFRARPARQPARATGAGLAGAFSSTFVLTLTNPMTILSFVAVFAGPGLGAGANGTSAALLVLGVVLGSAAWWLLLSALVARLRARFDERRMRWVNRLSGTLIAAFGMLAVLRSFAWQEGAR